MNKTNLFILLFLSFLLLGCGNNKDGNITVNDIHNPASANEKSAKKGDANMPVITFETNIHNFGKVLQGERLSYTFKFTNTGKSNLIVESTDSSCGCTTTNPPKAPIRPGENGEIKVTFDSKTKKGEVSNIVVVSANTYPVHTILRVNAEVIVP